MPKAPALSKRSSSSALKKWAAGEVRLKIAEMKSKLMSGITDLQIAEEMKLDVQDYNALKREMYESDKFELAGKNSEEVFIDYRLRQEGCIKDLEVMVNSFKVTKQYNAMVGAVRAKSDILDKIILRGQEFGVLEKVPERKMVIAGVMVAALSNDELRAAVAKETIGMAEVLKKYGDSDILGKPLKTAAEAALLPTALPPGEAIVEAAPVYVPKFSETMKPKEAAGGLSKVAGGKATAAAKATPKKALPFSLAE